MRLPRFGLCLAVLSCSLAAATTAFRQAMDGLDRFLRFVFAAVDPQPQLQLETGEPLYASPASWYVEPRVERHEAHVSHRAAARGI